MNLNEIVKDSKSVLVEFYATWCPHCQRMHPVLDNVEKKAGKKLKVVRLDIDAPENEKLVNAYKIQTIPTMLFFRNEEQVWRHSGEIPEAELEKIVSTYSA